MPDETNPISPTPSGASFEIIGGVRIAYASMRFQFSRSGGPGGQNVNKLNTKAELWVDPAGIIGMSEAAKGRLLALAGNRMTVGGEIHLWAETERTQERNRQAVTEKLRELVLRALVTPNRRRKTKPSAASKRRRLEAKRHRAEIKENRREG